MTNPKLFSSEFNSNGNIKARQTHFSEQFSIKRCAFFFEPFKRLQDSARSSSFYRSTRVGRQESSFFLKEKGDGRSIRDLDLRLQGNPPSHASQSDSHFTYRSVEMPPIDFTELRSRILIIGVLSAALSVVSPAASADTNVLDLFHGDWNVRVLTLQPIPAEVTYIESYKWVLDNKFIRGETRLKSDGTSDLIFATYDQQMKGYPFWIFSSTGSYTYLAPGKWDAGSRTLEWKNPPGWDVSYFSRCTFPDGMRRSCTVLIKDWKGKVLLEQEISAVRRED